MMKEAEVNKLGDKGTLITNLRTVALAPRPGQKPSIISRSIRTLFTLEMLQYYSTRGMARNIVTTLRSFASNGCWCGG